MPCKINYRYTLNAPLAGQHQIHILISLKFKMDSSRIELWTSPLKKLSKLLVLFLCRRSITFIIYKLLTLTIPNFLNGIIHLTFLALSIIILVHYHI